MKKQKYGQPKLVCGGRDIVRSAISAATILIELVNKCTASSTTSKG